MKKIEYLDLTISFEEQPDDTLNQEIQFSTGAINKNPELFKILHTKLKPNGNFIFQTSERKVIIPSLSKKVWYNHYIYQIMELIESNHLQLDLRHKNPLTHLESIGDLKSSKLSNDRKKEVEALKSQLRTYTFSN